MALPIYGYYMKGAYADPVLSLSINKGFQEPPDYDPKLYDCSEALNPEDVDETDAPHNISEGEGF